MKNKESNQLPKTDIHDAHTGRAGGNQIDHKMALEMVTDGFNNLMAGKTQIRSYSREFCYNAQTRRHYIALTVHLENANPHEPHYHLPSVAPLLAGYLDDLSTGKREDLGGTDLVIAMPGEPRGDVYTMLLSND